VSSFDGTLESLPVFSSNEEAPFEVGKGIVRSLKICLALGYDMVFSVQIQGQSVGLRDRWVITDIGIYDRRSH
jgi:hypothetical protein